MDEYLLRPVARRLHITTEVGHIPGPDEIEARRRRPRSEAPKPAPRHTPHAPASAFDAALQALTQ